MKEKKNHIYICSILLTKVRLTLKKKKKKKNSLDKHYTNFYQG
jgi:hypothetical protein